MKDKLNIQISIRTAHEYSNIPYKAFWSSIKSGHLEATRNSEHFDPSSIDHEYDVFKDLSDTIFISLSELPPFAIRKYLCEKLLKERELPFDLTSFQHWCNTTDNESVYTYTMDLICRLKNVADRHSLYYSDDSTDLFNYSLAENNLTPTQYYYMRKKFRDNALDILFNVSSGPKHHGICPLSEHFVLERLYSEDQPSQDEILSQLQDYAELRGADACLNCPFNQDAPLRRDLESKLLTIQPGYELCACIANKTGMRVPTNRSTISRIKSSQPDSALYYALHEFSRWNANYGSKVQRRSCTHVNEGWCIDAHEFDVYVYDEKHRDIRRPWVVMIIDLASKAIVGSSVSFYHNSNIVKEAFCRAACVTINSPFYGLPQRLQCDNGSELKSFPIRGDKTIDWDNPHIFFDDGLLKVLNVKQCFTKNRHPWSKPIERAFRTIESRWMRRLPGYCGGKKASRYRANLQENLARFTERGLLMDIVDFANYWHDRVVPEYNAFPARHKRPIDLYNSLPRAATITPSWSTMSVLLSPRSRVKVKPEGIHYGGCIYDDYVLKEYIGEYLYVYGYEGVYKDSVCVIYSNRHTGEERFIGEIFLKETIDFFEEDRLKLSRNLILHNMQVASIRSRLDILHAISDYTNTRHPVYVRYRIADGALEPVSFSEYIDAQPKMQTTTMSENALKIARWQHEIELKILEDELSVIGI